MDHLSSAIRARLDDGKLSGVQWMVLGICFMLNLVDGFDVVAMSVAAPALSEAWSITPEEKGFILSAALVGMALGAMVLAPMADRIGRRMALIMATVLIGISMIATAFIPASVGWMIAIRLISGLGIGVIFANGAAMGSEFAPEKYRNIAVTTIVMGYPFGAMVVGPIANWIIPLQGWEMLFVYGGLFTLLMTLVIAAFLPESVEYLASRSRGDEQAVDKINAVLARMDKEPVSANLASEEAPQEQPKVAVARLFEDGLGPSTLNLWLIYFMGFLSVYFLISWIPTLFVDSGFSRSEGIAALTLNNMGAVVGIMVIGLAATQTKLARPIAIFFIGAGICLAAIYTFNPRSLFALNALILAVGFLQQGAFTAMYAMSARVYPTATRATGIGWAAGLGRVGAILSPILAGYLVASGWDMYQLFLLFALPMIVAGLAVLRFKH